MNVEALFILHLAPGVDFYDVERFILREVPSHLNAQTRVTRAVTTYPNGQIIRHYKAYIQNLPASDIDLMWDANIKERAHLEGLGVVVTQYRPHANGSHKKAPIQEGVGLPGWTLIKNGAPC